MDKCTYTYVCTYMHAHKYRSTGGGVFMCVHIYTYTDIVTDMHVEMKENALKNTKPGFFWLRMSKNPVQQCNTECGSLI